jgi:glucose/arabinose dehydrogenase/mono/diheme cytochrome c family protein
VPIIPRTLTAAVIALIIPLAGAVSAQPLTRVAATSLRLPAVPPASNYSTERVFASLAISQPIALVTPPGETNRLFVVEKTGRILVLNSLATTPTRSVFLDLTALVGSSAGEQGLLSLAFHPDYARNGFFYVWFTLNTTTAAGSGLHNRLARYRVSATDPNLADPASQLPLLTQFDEASNHNGGELAFGPDRYLYLSLGDEGGANDQYANGQRIDRDFFAAILRFDVDLRPGSLPPNAHPAVHPGTYAVPPDNPFIGATTFNGAPINPAAVRTEFWAAGLRNPWRFSFDSATGLLWCADVGQGAREEINVIARGANYGWPFREGFIAGTRPNPPAAAAFANPVWDYSRSAGQSVTGGLVVRGNRYPALFGHYLFADYQSGALWALLTDGTNPVADTRVQRLATDAGIVSFGLNPATGDVLIADLQENAIKRLVANPAPGGTPFPATLSATGAFSDLATLTPAPGVVAYEPNVSFWSDHAKKRRWFALPSATTGTFGFSPTGNWSLPTGAVWVKHFDLETTRGVPSTARRLETRFLIKTADNAYGLTYRWNDAQTDAALVPDAGADATFNITENGVTRPQIWRFPGRGECLQCHTPNGGYALSFNTRQLNRPFPLGATAPTEPAHQLAALAAAGYLDSPTLPSPPAALPALAPADDLTKSLEHRARSFLDANCAQCHQPGAPGRGLWDARFNTPLSLSGIVNGPLATAAGNASHRVIVPGDSTRSQLLARLAGNGGARMPTISTNERDLAAESLLAQWIAALATPAPASRLLNLATRAQALGGSATLIPGFTVADAPKTLLIRAAGPALIPFGVTGAIPRPTLTLYRDTQILAANTGWNTAANSPDIRRVAARIGAFAFAENSADSALLATLAPGNYTAQITAANGATGVALVELYDADPTSTGTAGLINLSVRAQVGLGAQILIPGLTVGPGADKTVLIRAIGPGLAQFNVTGPLAQPVLTLFAGDEAFQSNTRWNSAPNAAEIRVATARVGSFALAEGSADSALLVSLSPGAYTLQISGANNTAGVALVEVYEIR